MNQNVLAKAITKGEGGKISSSIAQVKEFMRVERDIIRAMAPEERARALRAFEPKVTPAKSTTRTPATSRAKR